jgi:uncharacterized phage protein (TIGR02216 family)
MSADFGTLARAAARVATGRLGWSPDRFWAATPVELAAALAGMIGTEGGAVAPLGAAALARLRERLGDG